MHIRHQFPTKYTIRQDDKDWTLQEVEEERDLGIITTADFKVSRQCAKAAVVVLSLSDCKYSLNPLSQTQID